MPVYASVEERENMELRAEGTTLTVRAEVAAFACRKWFEHFGALCKAAARQVSDLSIHAALG